MATPEEPVYWAGPEPEKRYEVTRTRGGRTFVRYLDVGAAAGDKAPALTVATYPVGNALAATEAASKRQGAIRRELPDGGLAVSASRTSSSVYLAYPDGGEQIEVFAPEPGVARKLVYAGRIQAVPVGGPGA